MIGPRTRNGPPRSRAEGRLRIVEAVYRLLGSSVRSGGVAGGIGRGVGSVTGSVSSSVGGLAGRVSSGVGSRVNSGGLGGHRRGLDGLGLDDGGVSRGVFGSVAAASGQG